MGRPITASTSHRSGTISSDHPSELPPRSSRHERLSALFERALDIPSEHRAAFIEDACADDVTLGEDLVSLLEAHDAAGDYFDDLSEHVVAAALTAIALPSSNTSASETLEAFQAKLGDAYRLERELGGGGMSRVFVAEHLKLKRRVVIKVLPRETLPTANAERFQREIELAAQLQHPHIVPVLAAESADGTLYYTMPFVEGETLRDRLARERALPLEDTLAIWRDVLDALAHAHAHGVIHRDIKPGNILLSGRNALVTDFGIARAIETAADDARATTPGLAIGTPAYMAPEQAAGERAADHRIDIYAAGLAMYEMLAGSPPFAGGSTRELLQAHLTREPPPLLRPDAPPELLRLVMRCLAKDPAARPQSAEAILAQLGTATGGDMPTRRPRRLAVYAILALAFAAVMFAMIRWPRGPKDTTTTPVGLPSIAVLPLTNLSADPADAVLADGMTQELTAVLGKSDHLRVIASTSVAALQGLRMGVRQIADSLNISHVLEGSLQKAGSRLRMQVRLVDASDGSTRWSETYDREFADVFEVQEEIARAVAGELAVRLTGGSRAGANARRHTANIAAYEWYLRGMDVSLLRNSSGQLQGVDYFERAIALDSMFAGAYAGIVRMSLSLWNAARPEERRKWFERAREAALKAVAVDDSDANAQAALGWFRVASGEYDAAEAAFTRAIGLDAGVSRGHEGLARLYMMVGRPAEQLAHARRGLERDPLSHSAIRELALALATNDRCEESLEQLRALKTLSPPANVAGILIGLCYASRQRWPEAIAEFRWAADHAAASGIAFLGYALARAGQHDEASRILAELLTGRNYSHGAFGIATVYAGMRNYEQAFTWLEKAADDNSVTSYLMHPMFVDLHRDPRFERLERRMGVRKPVLKAARPR